jgi:hypothetical protein
MARACAAGTLLLACVLVAACKQKASPAECDQMLERYARLVVLEKYPDAGPDLIRKVQEQEKSEARTDDAFKNCSSEVSRAELDCAMKAATPDAIEKCLE